MEISQDANSGDPTGFTCGSTLDKDRPSLVTAHQSETQSPCSPKPTPSSTLPSEGEEERTGDAMETNNIATRASHTEAGPSNSRKRRLNENEDNPLVEDENPKGGMEILNTEGGTHGSMVPVPSADKATTPQDERNENLVQPTKKRRVEDDQNKYDIMVPGGSTNSASEPASSSGSQGPGAPALSGPSEAPTEEPLFIATRTTPASTTRNGDGPHPNKKARLVTDATAASGASPASLTNTQSIIVAVGGSQPTNTFLESSEPAKPSPLLTLPLELLSEVLILTGSPQHVLAVARTCKALCHTLLNPDAEFIWREARKGCSYVVPDMGPQAAALGFGGGGAFLQFWFPAPVPASVSVATLAPAAKKVVGLPDLPRQFFTEASYAAFLFDSGKCECCGSETSLLYESFGLRMRKCRGTDCRVPSGVVLYSGNNLVDDAVRSILPTIESNICLRNYNHPDFWPTTEHSEYFYYRREAVEAAKREYQEKAHDEEYRKKFALLQMRKREWMELCVKLSKWRKVRQVSYYRNKDTNERKSKTIANKYGWDSSDLVNCTIFGAYQKRKARLIEPIDEIDVVVMYDEIESQLIAVDDRRDRRNTEISLMENRKDVEGVYNRLRSARTHQYLPSLATFRTLPVVSLLQTAEKRPGAPSQSTTAKVAETLQNNPVMKEMLASQLRKWAENAKRDISQVLGFPRNWKSASKNVVHPAERVTARLLCNRCNRVDSKYSQDGCLDFAGACRHECFVGNEKKNRLRRGKKVVWDGKNFVKDEKAINVLKKTIQALGHAEDKDAGHYVLKVGIAALCTSCDPPMVVDTRNIIGHSHRHEDMHVDFRSDVERIHSLLGGYPYAFGLVKKLMDPSAVHTPATKKEIDTKNFGCRHCLRTKQANEVATALAAAPGTDAQDNLATTMSANTGTTGGIELSTVAHYNHDLGIEGPQERPPPLFHFNGLRSHLKAKHRIEDIRDEDVLCYNAVLI